MLTLAYFNQKGGVGKTTSAVHHAVRLSQRGLNTALVDVDRQRHASRWVEASPFGVTAHYVSPQELSESIRHQVAKGENPSALPDAGAFDVIVIDAPGQLDVAKPVLLVADVAVIPCVPSPDDVNSTIETLMAIQRVRQKRQGRPYPIVFLNRADRRSKLGRESGLLVAEFERVGVPVCTATLPHRAAFARARDADTVVGAVRFGRKAAREMDAVFEEIEAYGRDKTESGGPSRRAA